ncbi:hypothetical protein Hanom_Chr10g00884041 [Helianthus anomalus]
MFLSVEDHSFQKNGLFLHSFNVWVYGFANKVWTTLYGGFGFCSREFRNRY